MACREKFLVTICTLSLVSGLSVTTVAGWAFYIKVHNLEELYPKAEAELESGDHFTSRKVWNQMKVDWKNVQSRDLATIGIAIAAGLVQFVIGVILIYSRIQASSKTVAVRYIMSNIAVMFVLLICNLTTVSKSNMSIFGLPVDLKHALGLEKSSLIQTLEYGINAFNIWIGLDFFFLFVSIITMSCFLRNIKIHSTS